MYIDGKPGRYQYVDNKFVFEEGLFNTFGSNKLKIQHFIELLSNNNEKHSSFDFNTLNHRKFTKGNKDSK